MAKKHIKSDGRGNAVNNPKIKGYKAKTKKYESNIITDYLKARDRVFWKEGTPEQRAEIEERWKK